MPAPRDDHATPWRIWIPETSLAGRQESDFHVLLWQVRGTAEVSIGVGPEESPDSAAIEVGSRGQGGIVGDQETLSLTAGHALWIPVGTPHSFTVHENSVTMPQFFDAAGTATTLRAPTLVTVDRDLRTLLLAHNVSWYTLVRPEVNLARQIFALIEDRPVVSTALPLPHSEAALLIAEALRFNPGDIRTVGELAQSVHTSTRTIERAFQQETGMTLRQWRIRNRMETAAILLRSGATIDAVAHRVGYTNVNSFRRVFTGHFSLSPTVFAARYRAQ